jgi:hypothetical protein
MGSGGAWQKSLVKIQNLPHLSPNSVRGQRNFKHLNLPFLISWNLVVLYLLIKLYM